MATSYCEKSFKQYDAQYAALIAELKAAETKRRSDINKVIFDMIRKQVTTMRTRIKMQMRPYATLSSQFCHSFEYQPHTSQPHHHHNPNGIVGRDQVHRGPD